MKEEKRRIEDDELVEIVGAGEFAVGDDCGCRPAPGSPGIMHLPEKDNQSGGDVEMEGI